MVHEIINTLDSFIVERGAQSWDFSSKILLRVGFLTTLKNIKSNQQKGLAGIQKANFHRLLSKLLCQRSEFRKAR